MDHGPSLEILRQIDSACDRFEDEWRKGNQPQVDSYLLKFPVGARPQLMESLQELRCELMLKQPERVLPIGAALSNWPPIAVAGRQKPSAISDQTSSIGHPGQKQEWMPRVVIRVISGPHEGEEFAYDEHNTLLVGRSVQAQLRIRNDPHFSRHHFRLEMNPPTCFLMDLRSRNGTFVNGDRITEKFLQHGDVISGGQTKMVVSILSPGANSLQDSSKTAPVTTSPSTSEESEYLREFVNRKQRESASALRITGYRIHEQIGAGDLGTVFRATRISDGKICVLKVMGSHAVDEKVVQSFLRDTSILCLLKHPFIVRTIELGATDTELYVAADYVKVIPWHQLVSRCSAAQRIRMACRLIFQILRALEYAHARSLVHRDVKPGNILICRVNGKFAAKLADFGLARQYKNAGMSQVTREGCAIGSLPFMPPEQFINSRDARASCDIYGAGASLYWMLTGQEPLLLNNHRCQFLAILEDLPVPIQKHCPEIPRSLADLVHRSLEKSPEDRFQTAREMRRQLRYFCE